MTPTTRFAPLQRTDTTGGGPTQADYARVPTLERVMKGVVDAMHG